MIIICMRVFCIKEEFLWISEIFNSLFLFLFFVWVIWIVWTFLITFFLFNHFFMSFFEDIQMIVISCWIFSAQKQRSELMKEIWDWFNTEIQQFSVWKFQHFSALHHQFSWSFWMIFCSSVCLFLFSINFISCFVVTII